MLGACPGKNVNVANAFLQRSSVHLFDFPASNRRLSVAYTEHPGDGRSCDLVVTGNHGDADVAAVTFPYRLDGLLTRGIEEADQTEHNKSFWQVVRIETTSFRVRVLKPRECQHPFSLGGQPVCFLSKVLAVKRRRVAVDSLLAIAVV